MGIDYLCNGAACGAWWFGKYKEFPPMYAIIDLFEDGTFKSELVHYNWKQKNDSTDQENNKDLLTIESSL